MLSLPIFLVLIFYEVETKIAKTDCMNALLACDSNQVVCGIREEGKGYRLRMFRNECELTKFGCTVQAQHVYEKSPMHYCQHAFKPSPSDSSSCAELDCSHPDDQAPACGVGPAPSGRGYRVRLFRNRCRLWEHNCLYQEHFNQTDLYVCHGLTIKSEHDKNNNMVNDTIVKQPTEPVEVKNDLFADEHSNFHKSHKNTAGDLNSSRTQNFKNNDQNSSRRHNLHYSDKQEKSLNAQVDDDELYIMPDSEEDAFVENDGDFKDKPENHTNQFDEQQDISTPNNVETTTDNVDNKSKKLIVIRGALKDWTRLNETISRFFAATHVFDLPIKEMPSGFIDENTRRRLVKVAGPVSVYKPWITIPKNISEDYDHRPTLNSCFHKCPRKCPATYAPVCGVPGRIAREPSLMFQNHCFMDVAQCKMQWENKSPTSLSSFYQESSFVFCLGDTMNHMYSFMPLVKTLQHMGRLPKKSRFRYRLNNLKFFNNLLGIKDPRLMG